MVEPARIGRYEILETLSEDPTGRVYKAVDPSRHRTVAIKVLRRELAADEQRAERFHREAGAVALIDHPNVVRILEQDRDGDRWFFVMEYLPGSSLEAVLRRRRLSLHEAFAVFAAACRGLEAAHRQGVTHRDLNPRNILVSDDLEQVKLADFAIGRAQSLSDEAGTLSTAEVSMGSLHYMAPEQARDLAAADQRSDIYSAGAVFYELLTGRVPVGRLSLPSQLNGEVPPETDAIVLECLASNPVDRYATAGQLLQAVARLEDQLHLGLVNELRGISSSTSRILRRSTSGWTRRQQLLLAVLASILLLAAAAFFW